MFDCLFFLVAGCFCLITFVLLDCLFVWNGCVYVCGCVFFLICLFVVFVCLVWLFAFVFGLLCFCFVWLFTCYAWLSASNVIVDVILIDSLPVLFEHVFRLVARLLFLFDWRRCLIVCCVRLMCFRSFGLCCFNFECLLRCVAVLV